MLTLGLRPASNNSQIAWLETDHLAVAVHLATNHAAHADNGALRQRFVVEAVEQHQFDSVPDPEGATASHRFGFGAGAAHHTSCMWNTGRRGPLTKSADHGGIVCLSYSCTPSALTICPCVFGTHCLFGL